MRFNTSAALGGLGILCLAALLMQPGIAVAGVVLNPSVDTFVATGPPSTFPDSGNNYGAAGALVIAPSATAKGTFVTVIKFDMSSAKTQFDSTFGAGNWTVQDASLALTATNPGNPLFNSSNVAGNFNINWMQNNTWAEGTGTPALPTTDGITFSTLPSFTGTSDQSLGSGHFAGGTTGSTSYPLTLSSGFTTDVTSGNVSSLELLSADTSISYVFNSRSFGTASARPQLTIDAVATPEPGALGLLAIAGATLLLRRRAR